MKKICYVFLFLLSQSCSQKQDVDRLFGKWKIKYINFDSIPNDDELDEVWRNCNHQEVIISDSQFTFKSTNCSLYQSMNNFKITKHYKLTLKDATTSGDYTYKTISSLFDDGHRQSIEAYSTNYNYYSIYGEVPELKIFWLDNNYIALYQEDAIVFLER